MRYRALTQPVFIHMAAIRWRMWDLLSTKGVDEPSLNIHAARLLPALDREA